MLTTNKVWEDYFNNLISDEQAEAALEHCETVQFDGVGTVY